MQHKKLNCTSGLSAQFAAEAMRISAGAFCTDLMLLLICSGSTIGTTTAGGERLLDRVREKYVFSKDKILVKQIICMHTILWTSHFIFWYYYYYSLQTVFVGGLETFVRKLHGLFQGLSTFYFGFLYVVLYGDNNRNKLCFWQKVHFKIICSPSRHHAKSVNATRQSIIVKCKEKHKCVFLYKLNEAIIITSVNI